MLVAGGVGGGAAATAAVLGAARIHGDASHCKSMEFAGYDRCLGSGLVAPELMAWKAPGLVLLRTHTLMLDAMLATARD